MVKSKRRRVYKRIEGKVTRVVKPKPDWDGNLNHSHSSDLSGPKDYLPDVHYYSGTERKGRVVQ